MLFCWLSVQLYYFRYCRVSRKLVYMTLGLKPQNNVKGKVIKMDNIIYQRSNLKPKLFSPEKKQFRSKNVQENFYLTLRLTVYIACIIFFVMNSYAIFRDFLSNPTIISTTVIKSPNRLLEFPSILICSEQAFKTPVMVTDYEGYKNNTISLDDFLLYINFDSNLAANVLDVTHTSIKENVTEVLTAFHGTCFLSQEKLQVISTFH